MDVVDAKKGEVIGKITGLKLVHGIALAPEFNHGFISDGAANQVVVFDMKTLAKVGEVPAGMNPDGIIYDPAASACSPSMAAARAPPRWTPRRERWPER